MDPFDNTAERTYTFSANMLAIVVEVIGVMWNYDNSWSWHFGLGWLFMIVFWAALLLAVVALVKWLLTPTRSLPGNRTPSAREILDQRYARGDLTREQYEQMRHDLEQ